MSEGKEAEICAFQLLLRVGLYGMDTPVRASFMATSSLMMLGIITPGVSTRNTFGFSHTFRV